MLKDAARILHNWPYLIAIIPLALLSLVSYQLSAHLIWGLRESSDPHGLGAALLIVFIGTPALMYLASCGVWLLWSGVMCLVRDTSKLSQQRLRLVSLIVLIGMWLIICLTTGIVWPHLSVVVAELCIVVVSLQCVYIYARAPGWSNMGGGHLSARGYMLAFGVVVCAGGGATVVPYIVRTLL